MPYFHNLSSVYGSFAPDPTGAPSVDPAGGTFVPTRKSPQTPNLPIPGKNPARAHMNASKSQSACYTCRYRWEMHHLHSLPYPPRGEALRGISPDSWISPDGVRSRRTDKRQLAFYAIWEDKVGVSYPNISGCFFLCRIAVICRSGYLCPRRF